MSLCIWYRFVLAGYYVLHVHAIIYEAYCFLHFRNQQQLNSQLRRAAEDGNIKRVSDLLSMGAHPNWHDSKGGTALHWACWYNHPEIASLLIANNANTNILNFVNNTPLHHACYRGSLPCIPLLVDVGCDTG